MYKNGLVFTCVLIAYLLLPMFGYAFTTVLVWRDNPNGSLYKIDLNKRTLESGSAIGLWSTVGDVQFKNVDISDLPQSVRVYSFPKGDSQSRYLVIDCTQQVYEFDFNTRVLERIDKTYFRGFNCYSSRFTRKDTLYSFGGYGFWHTNNILTYYKSLTGEWESINPYNNSPESIFRGVNGYVRERDIFFSALNFHQNDSKDEGEMTYDDKVYSYSFISHHWDDLGKITSDVKMNLNVNIEQTTTYWSGKYFLIKYYQSPITKLLIIDPVANVFYLWEDSSKSLSIDPSIDPYQDYVWQDTLYVHKFIKTANGQIIQKKAMPIREMVNRSSKIGSFYEITSDRWNWAIPIVILMTFLVFVFYQIRKTKNNIVPANTSQNQIQGIANNLSTQELKVWEALMISSDGLSTERLNQLLGIDTKTPENQRRIRHEVIKSINSKMKVIYNVDEPVERQQIEADKRMFVYVLSKSISKSGW